MGIMGRAFCNGFKEEHPNEGMTSGYFAKTR
jgi:hypothetical protein